MKIAYITQLCGLTSRLIATNKEFLKAIKEHRHPTEISNLKSHRGRLYRLMREARMNITDNDGAETTAKGNLSLPGPLDSSFHPQLDRKAF